MNSKVSPRVETPEKNGDTCGHRVQEMALLQALTKRATLLFNV